VLLFVQTVILLSGFLSATLVILSLIPCFCGGYDRTPSRGILTSALISSYICYLTFSAINAQVNINIVDAYGNGTSYDFKNGSAVENCVENCFSLSPTFNIWLKGLELPDGVQERIDKLGWACNKTLDIETLITQFQRFYNTFAIVFTLVLTIYSAMASTKATTQQETQPPMFCCCCYTTENDDEEHLRDDCCGGQEVIRDDYHKITYRYWAFHLIYLAAGMFLMMTLTNWVSPSDNIDAVGTNQYTFWIKSITTIIIIVVYIVFLLAPLCCTKTNYQKYMRRAEREIRRVNRKLNLGLEDTSDTDDDDGIELSPVSVRKNRVEPVNYDTESRVSTITPPPPPPSTSPPRRRNPYADSS